MRIRRIRLKHHGDNPSKRVVMNLIDYAIHSAFELSRSKPVVCTSSRMDPSTGYIAVINFGYSKPRRNRR